jgi:hypothetical protein
MTEHLNKNDKESINCEIQDPDEINFYSTNFYLSIKKDGIVHKEYIGLDNDNIDEICNKLANKYTIDVSKVRDFIDMKILDLAGYVEKNKQPNEEFSVRSEMRIITKSGVPSSNNSSIISKKDKSLNSLSKQYNSSKCGSIAFKKRRSTGLSIKYLNK